MNNVWIVIAVVALLAAGGYYFIVNQNDEVAEKDVELVNENEEESRKLTLRDLFFMGEDFRCEFSHDDGVTKSSGVAYLGEAGERIRVDFDVEQSAAGPTTGSIIRKDNYNYLWSSNMEQGVKVAITEENKNDLFAGGQEGAIDENTKFDCVAWLENPAMYELPENVEFIDIAAMMGAYGVQ